MSLQYQVPKTATYLQTRNEFTAAFNVPTPGVYDFNVAGNLKRPVLSMNLNAIYLINRITIGATIPQDEYLFNIVTLPRIVLQFDIESQRVYPLSLPIVQFVDGMEAVAWFWTDKSNESLTMSLVTGVLGQDAFLVGVPNVKINVSMSIFEITDNGFIQDFKAANNRTFTGRQTSLTNSNFMYVEENERRR